MAGTGQVTCMGVSGVVWVCPEHVFVFQVTN